MHNSKIHRKSKPPRDVVDNARASVLGAISRLIRLLGHEDLAVVDKARRALAEQGGAAIIGALAAALPKALEPRHRGYIVMLLVEFAHEDRARVGRALTEALLREEDPIVSASIRLSLSHVIMSSMINVAEHRQQGVGPAWNPPWRAGSVSDGPSRPDSGTTAGASPGPAQDEARE